MNERPKIIEIGVPNNRGLTGTEIIAAHMHSHPELQSYWKSIFGHKAWGHRTTVTTIYTSKAKRRARKAQRQARKINRRNRK